MAVISNSAQLAETLELIKHFEKEYTIQRARAASPEEEIAFTGGLRIQLRQFIEQVTEYLGEAASTHSDFEFRFTGKSADVHSTRLNDLSNLLADFQTCIWSSAERWLGLRHQLAGSPRRRVKENCTLTLTTARAGSLLLGMDFIPALLFPEDDLQDGAAEVFAEVTNAVNEDNYNFITSQGIQPQFLNQLASLCRVIENSFESGGYSYRSQPSNLNLGVETYRRAEDYIRQFSLSERIEGEEGHLKALNFWTTRLEVEFRQQRVPMYYSRHQISEEVVEAAANKRIKIFGTAFRSDNGNRIERIVPERIEVLD